MTKRLATIMPELSAALETTTLQSQRRASVLACEWAFEKAGMHEALAARALDQLRVGLPFALSERHALSALAGKFDDLYFDLQEVPNRGQAEEVQYLEAFRKARAISALNFADENDAAESIYEAATAGGEERPELLRRLQSMLTQSDGK